MLLNQRGLRRARCVLIHGAVGLFWSHALDLPAERVCLRHRSVPDRQLECHILSYITQGQLLVGAPQWKNVPLQNRVSSGLGRIRLNPHQSRVGS